jgi:predicted nucleotidyltransferase
MKFLDPDTESAVRDFLARIPADIRLERAILFGSRARGEHKPDSDADLALILHERGNDGQTLMMLAGLAWYVFLDTGIMIQPVPIATEDWLHPDDFLRPGFLKNVERAALLRAGVAEDKLPRTHNGVIEVFRHHAVQSGLMDRQLAGELSRTVSLRIKADYTDLEMEPVVAVPKIERRDAHLQPISLEETRRQARDNWLRLRQQKIEGTRDIGHEELSPSPDNDMDE